MNWIFGKSQTLTIDELTASNRAPTLIIRNPPRNAYPDGTGIKNSMENLVEVMRDTAASFNNNSSQLFVKKTPGSKQEASEKTTEENKIRMRKLLERVRDDLTGVVEEGIRRSIAEMDIMTPEQQQEVIAFWKQIQEFIGEFLAWFDRLMDTIFEKLLEGYHLDTKLMSNVFGKAIDQIDSAMADLPSPHRHQLNASQAPRGISYQNRPDRGNNQADGAAGEGDVGSKCRVVPYQNQSVDANYAAGFDRGDSPRPRYDRANYPASGAAAVRDVEPPDSSYSGDSNQNHSGNANFPTGVRRSDYPQTHQSGKANYPACGKAAAAKDVGPQGLSNSDDSYQNHSGNVNYPDGFGRDDSHQGGDVGTFRLN